MAEESATTDQLLTILVQLTARSLYPEERVREVVTGAARQVAAYNLCDGTLTQAQVAKQAGLDRGNFSRTVSRWIQAGIVFRVGDARDARLLHLYPLSAAAS
jgi:DNA-binding MarR family transcriptional regulator